MNKKIAIVALCTVVALVLIGCSLFKNNDNGDGSNPQGTSGEVANNSVITVQTVTLTNNADNIRVTAEYPRITSFKNKEFENYINKQIASSISEYKNEVNYMVDDDTPPDTFYTYTTSYEKHVWGDYLTLIVLHDYQTGGIRSNRWKETYNVNTKTERKIDLSELFSGDYEANIVSEISKQADERKIKLMGGDGLKKLQTGQKFYIKDGKLVIYFDPSEVAAYKYGALEFVMPYTLTSDGLFDMYSSSSNE